MVESTNFQFVKKTEEGYKIVTESIPTPSAGKVLIKIAYSTCNPSDRYTYRLAAYERLGGDGSGIITAVGDGINDSFIGKKVAFSGGGWGQYKESTTDMLIFLDDSQDLSKAPFSFVNPLTAIAQLALAKKHGAKASISMAASS